MRIVMKYTDHYMRLITRALSRQLDADTYVEKHHILPKCLGGTDETANIARLTPEEHFVAHLLLVKMHPVNYSLVHAASMMCAKSTNNSQRSNKLYGWLRRRLQLAAKQRVGEKNGSFGTYWITNGIEARKIKKTDNMPTGFVVGRVIQTNTRCCKCDEDTGSIRSVYCGAHRYEQRIKNLYPDTVLLEFEHDMSVPDMLVKYEWKTEQNIRTYLKKHFPGRSFHKANPKR